MRLVLMRSATAALVVLALTGPSLAGSVDGGTIYSVVINHEEQYLIWPKGKAVPSGWKSMDKTCAKEECIEFIEGVWTDMRPQSVRKFLLEHLNKQE